MALPTLFENEQPIISRRLFVRNATANQIVTLPAYGSPRRIIAINRGTGIVAGLIIGTSNNGSQVLGAQNLSVSGVGGSVIDVAASPIAVPLVDTPLYVNVGTWNAGALMDLVLEYTVLQVNPQNP